MDWEPLEGLFFHTGATWLDTKVIEWNAIDPVASAWPTVVTRDASGVELPQAPKWSVIGLVNYRRPVSTALYGELGGDVSYTGSTTGGGNGFDSLSAVNATDSYAILNARIALGDVDDRWKVQLWSRNLTNEYYFTSGFSANGPYVRFAGMPRTFGVTLDYNF